jgi:hypothetical protein
MKETGIGMKETNNDPNKYTETEKQEEKKRARRLQRLVDFTLALIAQSSLSQKEAQRLVEGVRRQAHQLFPERKETFELIYTPRFRRLMAERFRMQ